MSEIRFDGRVAVVTGAGAGLGRAHALELARRGARVIVNDLGGSVAGEGASSNAAEAVVEEIGAAGGDAIADGADVTDETQVAAMVTKALDAWGRVDILINNAGILRDKTFAKMELADFRSVLEVHLWGSVLCTKAVWGHMREREYGRIVFTTSSSGLYGNFGQSNYGAAKMGVAGLMKTLHLEGAKSNIRVNALAPVASTRMTKDLFPEEAFALFAPEKVTPGVIYLVSDDAPSQTILAAGGGGFAVARVVETRGAALRGDALSAEGVAANWDQICDPAGQEAFEAGGAQALKFMDLVAAKEGAD